MGDLTANLPPQRHRAIVHRRTADKRCRTLRCCLPELRDIGNIVLPPLVKRYFADRVGTVSTLYITVLQAGTILPALVAVPVMEAAGWRISLGLWAVFAAASEAFSQRNINCSISESLARFAPIMEAAKQHGVTVRGYVSCVLGCPYEGTVAPEQVAMVARELYAMGCYEVSLGDTIGVGTPAKARAMLKAVAAEVPMDALAIHFHDTYGQALANILACLEEGVAVVDAAVSGAGGCPYAKGASGNVSSEDVVYMLHGLGITTGIDLPALAETGRWLAGILGRESQSKVGKALAAT